MEEWPANRYHIVSRNCVTFAEELTTALQAPQPFPTWVRGAIDAAKAPAIYAIADYGWEWFKWWSKRQAEQEAAEMEALAAQQQRDEIAQLQRQLQLQAEAAQTEAAEDEKRRSSASSG